MHRRQLLVGAASAAALSLAPVRARASQAQSGASPYGPLQPADANGIELPAGFSSRVVARTGQPVEGTSYTWHEDPDGGAVFDAGDGGWIYVSNSEVGEAGGVGAIRFAPDGTIAAAYPLLQGSLNNCAGGPTPWGTWLSCEETGVVGRVWECDPHGGRPARFHLAMGLFTHEAAAVDPEAGVVYLTEDERDGCYYRYRPATYPDLSLGSLEAAAVGGDGSVRWVAVASPVGPVPTRYQAQLAGATAFAGGEGCWYDAGHVYFTTKGDDRVWRHDLAADRITVLYDGSLEPDPVLSGVDNVTVTPSGDLLVAEDGGNMELVLVTNDTLTVAPFLHIPGHEGRSEIAGPALDASGTRLYFSSQRGDGTGGITYEVTGPFARPVAVDRASAPPGWGTSGPTTTATSVPRTEGLGAASGRARLPATGGRDGPGAVAALGLAGLGALAAVARRRLDAADPTRPS